MPRLEDVSVHGAPCRCAEWAGRAVRGGPGEPWWRRPTCAGPPPDSRPRGRSGSAGNTPSGSHSSCPAPWRERGDYTHMQINYTKLVNKSKQAFDSIAGNTVVPYRSLKKFFNYHKLLFIAIYNKLTLQIKNYNYNVQNRHISSSCRPLKLAN